MKQSEKETTAYKKAVKELVVGDSEKYRLAAPTHKNEDGGPTGGIKTLSEPMEFDPDENSLKFGVMGDRGGEYSLLVDFDEKRVIHAHGHPNNPDFPSAIYDLRIED